MLKPMPDELAEAKYLRIKGFDQMNGPQLREAICQARRRKAAREVAEVYQKWMTLCTSLGIVFPAGKNRPKLYELKRLFEEELPAALKKRGIVEGAWLTIPPTACPPLAQSGRAKVGKLWPMRDDEYSEGHIPITLKFDGRRAHLFDAWLIWRHATDIKPPRR